MGCAQIATNPDICAGGIPAHSARIAQTNTWHSLRVGLEAAVEFDRRWKLAVDAAWAALCAARTVRIRTALRIGGSPGDFSGPIPEDGNGWGYQFESIVHPFSDFSVGAGGRYWHMEATGLTHFEGRVVGFTAASQPVDWKLNNYGAFVQASVKLGPYPVMSP